MKLNVLTHNDVPVVQVSGEIDHWNAPEFEQKINKLIENGHSEVVVDFSDLSYIDSGGVSVLFLELQKIRDLKGKLTVVTENKHIIKILSLVQITKQDCFALKKSID